GSEGMAEGGFRKLLIIKDRAWNYFFVMAVRERHGAKCETDPFPEIKASVLFSPLARCYGVTMRAGASDTEDIQPTALPDSEAPRGKPGSLWILWIILVPLFYVLSIGPAQRLAATPGINPDILIVIYAPLRFVAD